MTDFDPRPADGKSALASTGVWGGVAALLGLILPPVLASLHLTPEDAQAGAAAAGQVITAVGILVGIYGRWRAGQPITSVLPKKDI